MVEVVGDGEKDEECKVKHTGKRKKDEICESKKLNGGCETGLRCAGPYTTDEAK